MEYLDMNVAGDELEKAVSRFTNLHGEYGYPRVVGVMIGHLSAYLAINMTKEEGERMISSLVRSLDNYDK